MIKHSAKIWIKHDLTTGKTKPFEQWVQISGGKPACVASYKTEEAAKKGTARYIKLNSEWYSFEIEQ